MARIRTIKPEFWDSPSTASASAVARLAFIAMWNWADDAGRGTANLKELEGFIFPNDDIPTLSGGTSENFRSVMAEVSEHFGVVFYTVDGRPYYEIPSWEKHQRNERTAKGKYPGSGQADLRPDQAIGGTSDNLRHGAAELPTTSGPGTGEQGNRGTGEQGNRISSSDAEAPDPDEAEEPEADEFDEAVYRLCNQLADLVRQNGHRVGTVGAKWWHACERLIRIDGYTPEQIEWVMQWATSNEFWSSNIRSMAKLREKFSTLKSQALAEHRQVARPSRAEQRQQNNLGVVDRMAARVAARENGIEA